MGAKLRADQGLGFADGAAAIASTWQTLPPKSKARFQKMAHDDVARHERDLETADRDHQQLQHAHEQAERARSNDELVRVEKASRARTTKPAAAKSDAQTAGESHRLYRFVLCVFLAGFWSTFCYCQHCCTRLKGGVGAVTETKLALRNERAQLKQGQCAYDGLFWCSQ